MHVSVALFRLGLLGVVLGGLGCREATSTTEKRSQLAAAPAFAERWIPWGSGPHSLSMRAAIRERLAEGVSAVALDSHGRSYLLDRLNKRVVRVAGQQLRELNRVEEDAEDLTVGGRDALAVYSPFRARIWVHNDGKASGEIVIPRAVAFPGFIHFDSEGGVLLENAFQESYRLGRVGLSQTTATVLRSKREGVWFAADGRALTVKRLPDGNAYLYDGRVRRLWAKNVLSVRLLGVSDNTVCAQFERRQRVGATHIARQLRCLDLTDSAWSFAEDLPEIGLYVPRRSAAMAGRTLAFINPEVSGLRLMVWNIDPAGTEVQR
jgi:hypothetical protein